MSKLQLELYVVGHSLRSQTAVENVHRICAARAFSRYELQVIDVLEQPAAAEAANIVATPTLIKTSPLPVRRIIGDLSPAEAVAQALGIEPQGSQREPDE
jgi:circadian clock protein KaiB